MDDFDRCVVEEISRLRRYALSLTRNAYLADDLVQDTLARALGKRNLFITGTDMRAWLFTILHNQYVNNVRKSVREGTTVDVDDVAPMLYTVPTQGSGLELEEVKGALATLPDEQRQAILLVGLEGLRYEEAAEIVNVPVGTIRSRLSRGRNALREKTSENFVAKPTSVRILPLVRTPRISVVLPPTLLLPVHKIGRPRNPSVRQRYATAANALLNKGVELTQTNLADELKMKRRAVEAFMRRNPELSRALGIVMRGLHGVDDYKNAIDTLIAKDLKATHDNIATELGLSKRGTVTRFLDAHPEIRAAYPATLSPRRENVLLDST